MLVWGVSQELVVDHGGARRCFLSLLISFQNSLIGIFFGELPHRCIETDLSDGLDLSLENEICALNAACVFLITQELYYY